MRGVEHMTELVLTQIKDVLDAFARRDVGRAVQVWRSFINATSSSWRTRSPEMFNSRPTCRSVRLRPSPMP